MMYSIHVYKLFRFVCNILFALAFGLKTKFGWIRFSESKQWSIFVAFPISYILLIHLFSQRRLLRKNLRIVTYKRSKNEQPKEQYVNERIYHQSKKRNTVDCIWPWKFTSCVTKINIDLNNVCAAKFEKSWIITNF